MQLMAVVVNTEKVIDTYIVGATFPDLAIDPYGYRCKLEEESKWNPDWPDNPTLIETNLKRGNEYGYFE